MADPDQYEPSHSAPQSAAPTAQAAQAAPTTHHQAASNPTTPATSTAQEAAESAVITPSPAFTNDIPTRTDVAIIGSGPGGYSCALRAAQLGLHVTLIERDAHAGGTCLNRGCIPTKALLDAAHAAWEARRGERLGFGTRAQQPDRERLLDFQHNAVRTMVDGLESLIKARRIAFVHGQSAIDTATSADTATTAASATEPAAGGAQPMRTVTVDSVDGTRHRISARHVVIATGATPRPLAEAPFGGRVLDSDAALELPVIPRSVIVIGSGAVGLEFASFWAAMGSSVTVLVRHGRPLSDWPRRVGASLKRGMTAHGVTFMDYTAVESCTTDDGTATLTVSTRKGTATLCADYCLVAIGRTPSTDAPWIEQTGVERDSRGFIVTDPWGRTTSSGMASDTASGMASDIWAVGDVTAGRQLAHRAFAQGRVVAETMAGLSPAPVRDELVPRVVFSLPEAASVGLDADQAKSGTFGTFSDVRETAIPMDGNARTAIAGDTGLVDIVTGVDGNAPDSPRLVLGVHMAGPHVSEFIGEAQQIVRNRIPLAEAALAIHAHPTFSEALGEALLKADGSPLHTM